MKPAPKAVDFWPPGGRSQAELAARAADSAAIAKADEEADAVRVRGLTPPDRLRLAAMLVEARRFDLAYRVALPVVEELRALSRSST